MSKSKYNHLFIGKMGYTKKELIAKYGETIGKQLFVGQKIHNIRLLKKDDFRFDRLAQKQPNSILDRQNRKRVDQWQREIYSECNIYPVHKDQPSFLLNQSSFLIKSNQYSDWNIYSKSYRGPAQVHHLSFCFVESFVPQLSNLIINTDNISFYKEKEKTIKETTIYSGFWFQRGKGYEIKQIKGFLVGYKEFNLWAHGLTLKQAKKALKDKINKVDLFKNLTSETMITKTDYHNLTGACMAGINKFLADNQITDQKLPAGQVLKLVKEKNGYGWNKLESLLNN
jgi:hypothetical protein